MPTPLPPSVRVKLSSEAAEAISLTPVVVQDMPSRDLIEHILSVTGKDEARIAATLLRGTLVCGASRFRWQACECDLEAVSALLATFPDPEPLRPFDAAHASRATLRGGRQPIELPREAAAKKGIFQRESFWDALLKLSQAGALTYLGYSYRERCDRYGRDLSHAEAEQLRAAAESLKYSTLRGQIRQADFTRVELFAAR